MKKKVPPKQAAIFFLVKFAINMASNVSKKKDVSKHKEEQNILEIMHIIEKEQRGGPNYNFFY